MRNAIKYYYGIDIEDLRYEDGYYVFEKYLLVPKIRELDLKLYEYISKMNIYNYKIVLNKENKHVTEINNSQYILLERINNYQLTDDNLINNTVLIGKQKINWDILWEEKLDYYEDFLRTVPSKRIKETFIYYNGLTENAIKFYKEIKSEHPVFLSHLRLNKIDYLNPVNCIVDYRARDIAEYIKTCFFNDDINKLNLRYILSNLDKTDILILYSRLLYPSYYYDCCEKISNGYDEQILELYINKIDEYEIFLKELYFDIKDKFYIPMIDWIIKKDLSYDKSIVHPYQMIED